MCRTGRRYIPIFQSVIQVRKADRMPMHRLIARLLWRRFASTLEMMKKWIAVAAYVNFQNLE